MKTTPTFDVFLSYKSEDAPWVEKLKGALQKRGVKVWLDQDQIRPGDLFAQALESGLATSKAVALIVTPESVESNWVKREYYRALSKATQGNLQLIPVLLRKAELPGFLSDLHHVDFRNPKMFEQNVDKLIWPGITGKRVVFMAVHPGHGVPWANLLKHVNKLGLDFVEGQDIDRAMWAIEKHQTATTRLVIVVDIFEDWPSKNAGRRNTPKEYVNFIFNLREKTRGSSQEPIFLLYHHSTAWKRAKHSLDQDTVKRLQRYYTLHQDTNDGALPLLLRNTWHQIQQDLLKTES